MADPGAASDLLTLFARQCLEPRGGGSPDSVRQLIEIVPAPIYTCDTAGRIRMFNQAAVDAWGRSPTSEDRWCAFAALQRPDGTSLRLDENPAAVLVQQGRPADGAEFVAVRSDGARRHVVPHPRALFDAGGRIAGVLVLCLDVTERRVSEESARAAARRLSFALEAARMGDWTWEARTDRLTLTGFAAEVAGIPSGGEISRDHLRSLMHPGDVERIHEIVRDAMVRRVDYDMEYRLRNPAGEHVWLAVKGRGIYDAAGALVSVVGVMQDISDRKAYEHRLQAQEARLRLATRAGKLGVWDWDVVRNLITWTDSLYEIHGVDRGSFPHTVEAFAALVHPEDRKPVEKAIQSSLEHDAPYELEFRVVRPGGAVVWVFANAIVVREAGRPVRMLGATFDITARKQAELALRESELRFRTLAHHAPVGIFLADPQGMALYVNDTWRGFSGLAIEQVRGQGWTQALHAEDRDRVTREWAGAVASRRPFLSEYRFQRPDGTVTWLQGRAVEFRNASGAHVGYLGTVMDVTQRRAVEDALRESEHRFRTLASHAPVGIFLTDPRGETIFVNNSWCRMAGLAADEAKGRGWARAMHPEDRARVAAEWSRALVEHRSSRAEYRFLHADGTVTWVQGNAVQLRDEAGELAGYIGTVADLTERKAAEQRLRDAQAELQAHADQLEQRVNERTASLREAIAQMEEFSYSVSHDLRAPLRAMNAYAQALVDDYSDRLDETARSYLERIQRSSVRMEKLTHDVLTYSRVARAAVELREVQLGPLLRDVVLQYHELQAPAAEVQVAHPLLAVRAHEASLGQCLANLLTNAVKFVAAGTAPVVRVRTEPAGDRVRLWIEDNGIGIAPEYQARLFRVFERVPTRQPYAGTGIGLAIVRKAIEKMGGACGVQSDGHSGSRFWIELPRA